MDWLTERFDMSDNQIHASHPGKNDPSGNKAYNLSILKALAAALLYAVSSPVSKLLLKDVHPLVMASALYLGAGLGMGLVTLLVRQNTERTELPLTRAELPFVIGMVILDIAAPFLLMTGLMSTSAAAVSLLNNFEIVATSIIAFALFKEIIPGKLRWGILFITAGSILLSLEDPAQLQFSAGSLLILAAAVCWGLENNCTRMLSGKDPLQIVVIKGLGSLALVAMSGTPLPGLVYMGAALVLGFFSYGVSIFLYVRAQRDLGAARTSAWYAAGPFIGVILSFVIFQEAPGPRFFAALALMAVGAVLAI